MFLFLLITLNNQSIHWNGIELQMDRIEQGHCSYQMRIDDKKVGSWDWTVERQNGILVFKDTSILDGSVREDAIFSVYSVEDRHYKIDLQLVAGPNSIDNKLEWREGQVVGSTARHINDQATSKVIDEMVKEAIPREIFLALIPAMVFDDDFKRSMAFYSMIELKSWPLELVVGQPQQITVPAGTFLTRKVELNKTGSEGLTNHVFVTTAKPYRIVRVDAVELGMQIVLMPPG